MQNAIQIHLETLVHSRQKYRNEYSRISKEIDSYKNELQKSKRRFFKSLVELRSCIKNKEDELASWKELIYKLDLSINIIENEVRQACLTPSAA